MIDDDSEKAYNSFMVNRGLSYFQDTIIIANEMNKHKRFSKWAKAQKESDIDAVKEYYGYSNEKARQALTLLSPDQITIIKNKVSKGGRRR